MVSGLRWNLIWNSGLRVQFDGLFFAEARPEELTPHVMVLLAQHLARHRLREPQLLEAIAHFLVVQEAQLNSKVGLPPTLPCSSPGHPQPPCQAQPLVRLDWLLLPAADNPARLSAVPQGSIFAHTLLGLSSSPARMPGSLEFSRHP